MRKPDLPLILLAISAFLAPVAGGYISLESLPSTEGMIKSAPILTHTCVAAFAVLAFVLMMRRQVVQVPNNTLAGVLASFFGLIAVSVALSSFRLTTLGATAEWLLYGVAFFTTVATVGRRQGPRTVMAAIFAGCVLLSLIGIREYQDMKPIDPSWRIFANWVNPNASAAMFLIGLFLGLGVLVTVKERLAVLASGVGVALIGLALFLTGSKGGLLMAMIGMAVYLPLSLSAKPEKGLLKMGSALGAALVLSLGVMATAKSANGAAAAGAAARLAGAGQTSDQSAGFRTLLWKGAAKLIEGRPIGYGMGTYQFESARPGLTTPTTLTHQSFLQLGVEGSVLLPILLMVAGILWTRLVFRGWKSLPSDRKALQSAVFAAVVAIIAHSFIDSDLHYFGTGFSCFILLGLGLLLSADAVAPEYTPIGMRSVVSVGALTILGLGFYTGIAESNRAEVRSKISERDYQGAVAAASSLVGSTPIDGIAWYFQAQLASDPTQQIAYATRAAELMPIPRHYRFLARVLASQKKYPEALTALRAVLFRDPNNLLAMRQIAQIEEEAGNIAGARATYHQLVAVESTPYFDVRSIPQLVPTETFWARTKLAADLKGREKVDILAPAVEGYRQYLLLTVPQIKSMAPNDYGGETAQIATEKLGEAALVAQDLAATYRLLGEGELADKMTELAAEFAGAFESK